MVEEPKGEMRVDQQAGQPIVQTSTPLYARSWRKLSLLLFVPIHSMYIKICKPSYPITFWVYM